MARSNSFWYEPGGHSECALPSGVGERKVRAMRIEQLEQGLDRYGGDLARWPAAMRAEAEVLIAVDKRAAMLAATAARVDSALAEAIRPMDVDSVLIGRIVAETAGSHTFVTHDVTVRPTGRLVAFAGAAMVAFLVTGYAVGLALPASQGEDAFAGLIFGNSTTSDSSSVASDSGSVL